MTDDAGKDWCKDLEVNYGKLYVDQDGTIVEEVVPTIDGNYGKYYDNIYQSLTLGAELLVKPEQTIDVLRIIEAAEMFLSVLPQYP